MPDLVELRKQRLQEQQSANQTKQSSTGASSGTQPLGYSAKQTARNESKASGSTASSGISPTVSLVEKRKARLANQKSAATTVQVSQPKETNRTPSASLETNRGALAYCDFLNKTDRAGANELYTGLKSQWGDYNSGYSRPYINPTNKSKAILEEAGIDTSNIDADWYAALDPYMDYLPRANYTNDYATPTKKQLRNQNVKIGWAVKQYHDTEDFTVQAETEYAQLQKDIEYLVKDPHHYSPDKIVQMLDIPNNYKALAKMDEGRTSREPVELNRAVNYNGEDDLYTLIYQAMNGSSGNYLRDMINSGYDGWWQEDPEIAAKAAESPYTVGMVGLDDAGKHFGRYFFDMQWVWDHEYMKDSTDPEEKAMYQNVRTACLNIEAAKEDMAKLAKSLETQLKNATDPNKVLSNIKWSRYKSLDKINQILGTDDTPGSGDYKQFPTSEAFGYSYAALKRMIEAKCEENRNKLDTEATGKDLESKVADTSDIDAATGADAKVPEGMVETGIDSSDEKQKRIDAYKEEYDRLNGEGAFDRDKPLEKFGGGETSTVSGGGGNPEGANAPKMTDEEFISHFDANYKGNIDINNRPIVLNDDGSFSTDETITVGFDDVVVVIPTVVNGQHVSDDEAIQHYLDTGEFHGEFDTQEEADAFAMALHDRQEKYYAAAAKEMNTPPSTPPMTEQEKEIVKVQDGRLTDGADMMDGIATGPEMAAFGSTGFSMYDPAKQMVNRFRNFMMSNQHAQRNFIRSIGDAEVKYHAKESLATIGTMYDYDKTEQDVKAYQLEYDNLAKELGNKVYAGKRFEDAKEELVETKAGTFMVTFQYNFSLTDSEGKIVGGYEPKYIEPMDDVDQDKRRELGLSINNITETPDGKAVLDRINEEAAGIQSFMMNPEPITEEDEAVIRHLRELELLIDDDKEKLANNRMEAEEAKAAFNATQKQKAELIFLMRQYGLDTTKLEQEDDMVAYLTGFGEYDRTVWSQYNSCEGYHIAMLAGADPKEVLEYAKGANDKNEAELKRALEAKSYFEDNQINVPKEYMDNLNRHITKLQQNIEDYHYFELTQQEDFKKVSAEGKAIYDAKLADAIFTDMGWVNPHTNEYITNLDDYGQLLTETERQTYYYLLGSGNEEAAKNYLGSLERMSNGVLHTRFTTRLQEKTSDFVKDNFLLANALAVVASPLAALASLGYMGYSFATGEELNPDNILLFANNFKSTTREESARSIEAACGDNALARELVQGFYEIVTNRLDSIANFTVFGGMASGITNSMLSELVSASPMGVSAAMDAMAEAKRNGASDGQAWAIGFVTFMFETGTEAVSIENISDAIGKGADPAATMKDFVTNWLTKGGVSEAVGETVTEIAETKLNEWVMGKDSDYSDAVWNYRMAGYGKTEAEALAKRDQYLNYARTALISYLSPGADIASFAFGRAGYYKDKAKSEQLRGNKNATTLGEYKKARTARKEARANAKETLAEGNGPLRLDAVDEMQARHAARDRQAEIDENGIANGEGALNLPPRENVTKAEAPATTIPETAAAPAAVQTEAPAPIVEEAASPEQNADAAYAAYSLLEEAKTSDTAMQTGTIADLLGGETEESQLAANAAAANISNIFDDPISDMQDLMIGASAGGVDINVLNQAITNAVLGGEKSLAWNVMQSRTYQNANPEGRAWLLADTVSGDSRDSSVANATYKAVREWRIAQKEADLIKTGALDGVQKAEQAADNARRELQEAEDQLEERRGDVAAAQEALQAASYAVTEDPGNADNVNAVTQAVTKLENATEVEQEYEQQAAKVRAKQKEAEENAQQLKESAMADIRQQAAAAVAQEDQQAAERAAMEEQARAELAAAEAQAQAEQAIVEEETNNANVADVEGFLDVMRQENPGMTAEDEAIIRERFNAIQGGQPLPATHRDENGQMTPEAKSAFLKFKEQVSKKFGIDIYIPENAADDQEFNRADAPNGYFDRRNNRIVLNPNANTNDAMYFVLAHELTHISEKAGTYKQVANALLRFRYGADADFDTVVSNLKANGGKPTTTLEADLLEIWKRRYDQYEGRDVGYSYALQEMVADQMGALFNPKDANKRQALIDQLVAEEPSTARQIMESIKRAIKQMFGMKGAWMEYSQQTVALFEHALKQAQGQSANQESDIKHSLGMTTDGRMYVKVDTDQDIFDNLTPEQILLKADSIIKKRFKGLTVGFQDSDATVTKRTAEEYARPANRRLDSSVREVKGRASTELDNLLYASKLLQPDDPDYPQNKYDENHNPNVNRWSYYRTLFDVNGQTFKGIINIARMQGFSRVHDITGITKDTSWTALQEDTSTGASAGATNGMVSQENPDVKPLVQDDQGNNLATELPGGTVAVNTDVKRSLNTWTPDEQERVRKALIDTGRYAVEQVDKYLKDTMGLASMIAADKTRLDFEVTDPEKSMVKPNSDYGASIDASTLCAKRLVYQGTFDAIQHLLPNTPLMPEDLIDLSNMMREMGYETPCGICYVESRRRNLGKEAQKWLDGYKGEYVPKLEEVTTSDGLEGLRKDHPQTYDDFMQAMSDLNQRNPKVVQLRTEYKGEIADMTDKAVQKAINHGGLRLQSFSDFETPHLLDMVQVVMDMASKGLTSQAYTMVPNFAWAFGDTGIKINLSLIGKGKGVDENGNLLFDDVEGMPFSEAMKLRDRYSKNVGTILVGINDDQIRAAMADPRIDFIIPFHRSGWTNTELAKMPVLENYTDYQNDQNEKKIVERKANGKGYKTMPATESKLKNFEPVGQKKANGKGMDGYWDFTKTGKENAEAYLKMCAEDGRVPKFSQFLVDNGDGSFSLQPDGSTDGYWKTLIDFKMYDNDGAGSPQTAVTPDVNMPEAMRILDEYSLDRNGVSRADNNSLPVAQPVVDRYVEEYKAKHPLDENRVRYSLPADAPYMAAVERGEMDEAQRMVDEKAKKAGYNIEYVAWRGDSEPYYELEAGVGGGNLGTGLYFTPNRSYAERFATRNSPVRKFYLKTNNTFDYDAFTEEFNNYAMSWLEYNDMDPRMDVDSETWSLIWDDFISENDYDSVKATGVGGLSYGASEIAVQESWQAKLADPVTYDDQGNVIPLSERFNDQQKDIRYSLPSESYLDQRIREYLANGGILSTQQAKAPAPKQRQFGSQTAQQENTMSLHDQVRQYLRENSDYDPDTNRAQVDRALAWVQSFANGIDKDGYYGAVNAVTSPDFDYRSADGQARMLTVMAMAAQRNNGEGDISTELQLADAYNKQGTDLGRMLQARKLFQMMTPTGRQAALKKEADKINEEYAKRGKKTRVKLTDDILQEAGEAKTKEEFDAVRKKAAKQLAAQMPVTWKERLVAWRMLSMLGNPRTHIRNILGNAIFMPVVGLKNKVGALAEVATGQKTRTKTLGLATQAARNFAKTDAKAMENILRGGAKYNDGDQVQQERKIFGNTILQRLSDFNSNKLEQEDWIFLQRHYRNALAGYMTANKLKASDMTGATLEAARTYAVQEAQKATYRDANAIATWLNKAQKEHPAAGFVVNAVLPFKKTPANILKRGVEYSPIGLINAVTRGAWQVKMWNDYQNGKLSTLPDKAISPNQWIDKIASGLTGTAIMAMGAILANLGAVHAGLDDDDDELKKLQGEQEYAINPGMAFNRLFGVKVFGEDATYTIDWAAPVCMPFFTGAAIFDSFYKESGGDVDITKVLDSIMGITEPVFNLSMLDGVNSLLNVSQYAEGNAITQIGEKVITNYATSYIPTLLGQAARTIDTTRRKSYVESGANLSNFRYALESAENKIPWLSKKNIPYRNVWGEADTSGQVEAAIENFISPGYANRLKNDPVVNELERLYQATGNKNMIPKSASKTVSVGGETIKLNAEQYDQYVVDRGSTAKQLITDLMESPLWLMSDDDTRANLVEDAWTYANQLARHHLDSRAKVDGWIISADASGNAVDSIIDRAVDRNKKNYISGYGESMAEALDNEDYEAYSTSLQALEDAGATASQIKGALRDYFKPLYQAAYMSGDDDAMEDIEDKLMGSDADFDQDDFDGWVYRDEDEDEVDYETYQWLNLMNR